jgi:hypothetical protein
MSKQMLLSIVVTVFGLSGLAIAQEPAKPRIPATVDGDDADAVAIFEATGRALGSIAQIRNAVPDFTANFDRAAQTVRPAPLAPGSAEIP